MPTRLTVTPPRDFAEFRKTAILQGIHQRFEEQVHRHPQNMALKTRATAHTYAETNGYANSIAEEILSHSGTELARVALLLPNTTEMIVTTLASLKAHKAYVPLDSNFPRERLRVMLEDAEPLALLTDDRHMELAAELAGRTVRIINTSQIRRYADAPNPQAPCDPLDLAYILYTSGSTGRPKGIAFLHRNLLHTTMCLTNQLFFSPSDRVTWLHSASFAASVVDIYCGLTNGGTLYPWDAKTQGFAALADWLVREKVTTFQWIPTAFRQFLRTVPEDFQFPDIRIVVMASESLTMREVELFRRHFPPGSHLVNQVGTSESYNYRLYPVDHHIPIENANVAGGYPVSEDRQVLILDDQLRELPQGGVGEIGVKSDYMSAGYWRDPTLTASKFVRLNGDGVPVYLTGDLGKLEPDGCLIHLGRKDFQVKIRGYRVELAEIEHVLATAPGVSDAAAWVVKNRRGDDQLVGYVLVNGHGPFDQQQVQNYVESRLPDYMVPRRYLVLDSFPVLPTGKVNRQGLPNPFEQDRNTVAVATLVTSYGGVGASNAEFRVGDPVERQKATAPRSTPPKPAAQPQPISGLHDEGQVDRPEAPTTYSLQPAAPAHAPSPSAFLSQSIARIFRELLQLEDIDSESHFFQLGGDSLLTALLMHRIYQHFCVEINIDGFTESPTPSRLAALIEAAVEGRKNSL